jgi:hypothetical protein
MSDDMPPMPMSHVALMMARLVEGETAAPGHGHGDLPLTQAIKREEK